MSRPTIAPVVGLAATLPVGVALLAYLSGSFHQQTWGTAVAAGGALVAGVVVGGSLPGERLRGAGGVAVAAMIALLALGWASVPVAGDKGSALAESARSTIYLAALLVPLAVGWSRTAIRTLLLGLLAATALVALLDVALLAGGHGATLHMKGRVLGHIGYYNAFAAMLACTVPLTLFLAARRDERLVIRTAAAGHASLAGCVIVLAQSRGALAALAGALLVALALGPMRMRVVIWTALAMAPVATAFGSLNDAYAGGGMAAAVQQAGRATLGCAVVGLALGLVSALIDRRIEIPRRVVRAVGALTLAALVAAIVGGGALVARSDLANRAESAIDAFRGGPSARASASTRFTDMSNNGRIELWRVAAELARTHPARGVGANNYEDWYYRLRSSNAGSVRQPHSLGLELAAERGLAAPLMLLVLAIAVLWRTIRIRRSDASLATQSLVVGAACGFATWLLHAQVDWLWQIQPATLPAFALAGVVLAAPWRITVRQPCAIAWRVALAVPLLAGAIGGGLHALAGHHTHEARRLATTAPRTALAHAERAVSLTPYDASAWRVLANRREAMEDLDGAASAAAQQVALDPNSWTTHVFAAQFHARAGHQDEVRAHVSEAQRLTPLDKGLGGKYGELIAATERGGR